MKSKIKEELIGKKIKVVEADNASLIGIEGKIIDETKNTIKVLDKNNNEKILVKIQIKFAINGQKIIDGKTIAKRSEERIK